MGLSLVEDDAVCADVADATERGMDASSVQSGHLEGSN